ncbi:protein translocase subunit SecD [Chitinispirillales bacterium ANBcel5]|uniref:protein translocase subunit SecD n=1 Tax=Cellulosispirillum alkaliphilum TaxID=3039283 RepID=UPI002A538C6A|nr:protein translocase subunit SecD [Chitinispirillales bacterium ANBcel5]
MKKKNNLLRIGILVAVFAAAVFFLIPSFRFYSMPPEQRELYKHENPNYFGQIVNLGLDLQGGMRLVLEIDRAELGDADDSDVLDRAYAILENRINALGVAEPSIQKQGNERLIIELPGIQDEQAARDVIGRTAQLQFNLLRDPTHLERAINVIENVVTGSSVDSAVEDEEADTAVQREEQDLADRLFGAEDDDDDVVKDEQETETRESFRDLLIGLGDQVAVRVEHQHRINEMLERPEVRSALQRAGLGGNSFLWGHDVISHENREYRTLYYVKSSPEMTGDIINDARAAMDHSGMRAGAARVNLELNAEGARRFASVTGNNVNSFMAIVLDNTVYSAPRIQQRISGGRAEITGSFTLEEAQNLSIILRAGALPAPVEIIEERTVGPSLGQDSIEKGVQAGLIGAAIVILFILAYYKLSGLIAIIALTINVAVVLAIMAAFNAVLTLPGIAGLILLVGMAVDANVIIFERIREELALGKTIRSAIDSGYSSAFVTIMDANLTTLITAAILYWKGTGPIRGFSITLMFGIVASLFTALFVSRVLMDIFFQRKAKISI